MASFEASVGGSRLLVEPRRNFQEILLDGRWVPFFVEVPAPANEEVDGTRNRPSPNISTSIHRPIKLGPLFWSPKNSRVPVKIFLLVTACSCSTPFGIPSWRLRGSRACFGTDGDLNGSRNSSEYITGLSSLSVRKKARCLQKPRKTQILNSGSAFNLSNHRGGQLAEMLLEDRLRETERER